MMTAALLALADLRAVRTGLRRALFARFFTVVLIGGPPQKNFCGRILPQREYWSASNVTEGCEAPVEPRISPFDLESRVTEKIRAGGGLQPRTRTQSYCTVAVKTSSIAVTVPLLGISQLGGSSCSRLSVQMGWETPPKETKPS